MGYLGTKPANSPLTSELIPDGIITSSDLATSGVTAGTYTNASVTVNSKGIITSASSGSGVSTDYGAIGTYVLAAENTYTNGLERLPDVTVAGSTLVRSTATSAGNAPAASNSSYIYAGNVDSGTSTSLGLSGTWRRMTRSTNSQIGGSAINLYVRIS